MGGGITHKRVYGEGDRASKTLAWLLRGQHPKTVIYTRRGPGGNLVNGIKALLEVIHNFDLDLYTTKLKQSDPQIE